MIDLGVVDSTVLVKTGSRKKKTRSDDTTAGVGTGLNSSDEEEEEEEEEEEGEEEEESGIMLTRRWALSVWCRGGDWVRKGRATLCQSTNGDKLVCLDELGRLGCLKSAAGAHYDDMFARWHCVRYPSEDRLNYNSKEIINIEKISKNFLSKKRLKEGKKKIQLQKNKNNQIQKIKSGQLLNSSLTKSLTTKKTVTFHGEEEDEDEDEEEEEEDEEEEGDNGDAAEKRRNRTNFKYADAQQNLMDDPNRWFHLVVIASVRFLLYFTIIYC